jgi:hypothetical protein
MFRHVQGTLANIPSLENNITATAGGTKAAAYVLTKSMSRISTCATAADSVLLPAALYGASCFVANDGAASAQVFGQGTDTIDGVATATGVAIANGKRRMFVCFADGAWTSLLGA